MARVTTSAKIALKGTFPRPRSMKESPCDGRKLDPYEASRKLLEDRQEFEFVVETSVFVMLALASFMAGSVEVGGIEAGGVVAMYLPCGVSRWIGFGEARENRMPK